jgi:hypothetical protein
MTTDAKIILIIILQAATIAIVAFKTFPKQANTNSVNIEQAAKFK